MCASPADREKKECGKCKAEAKAKAIKEKEKKEKGKHATLQPLSLGQQPASSWHLKSLLQAKRKLSIRYSTSD